VLCTQTTYLPKLLITEYPYYPSSIILDPKQINGNKGIYSKYDCIEMIKKK
jgi:hypothetical protein